MLIINYLKINIITILLLASNINCSTSQTTAATETNKSNSAKSAIVVGAAQSELYLDQLNNKRIGLVVNQTSMMDDVHLVDYLFQKKLNIIRIFAPEHGFRGDADAGEHVTDGKDKTTNLPIKSLYGSSKKPSEADLKDLDVVVFDIQDVGARFYTYISTLHYVMDACAQYHKKLIVLDRPNPNGHYVDGPILEKTVQSFVGLDPLPIVHGMTIGELAQMINGENWLESKQKCDLSVIKCLNYDHQKHYDLPIPPSPNLRTMRAIYMYPTLCLFEGTCVSVGRGTDFPFEMWGSPSFKNGNHDFTPKPGIGSKDPFQNGKNCNGFCIHEKSIDKINNMQQLDLELIINFYKNSLDKNKFFLENNFFDKLAGNSTLRKQIIEGKTEAEIRNSWKLGLNDFKAKREKYLIY